MRLSSQFVTQDIDGIQFLIALGDQKFKGVVRNNRTAAFIVNLLKVETTKERIISEMRKTFDAPEEMIAEDVDQVLHTLRSIDALEE